ncbi:MAG: DNA/RNA non-specific endonuclease [Lentisphaeria bacterium]|nr:DNA/RNA non-specific endonuclease [Lentisphaeria bacterium]
MTKRKNSKKRKNVKIKLPFGVIVTLIIVALIVIGCWVYLHPDDAKNYFQTQAEKIFGKTTRPASPLPSTNGSDNLAFGIPGPADTIIDREGYALGYIEYHEQPAWVIYHMTYDEATTKATSRNDNFREDPEIPSGSATLADYRGSGYDRGPSRSGGGHGIFHKDNG